MNSGIYTTLSFFHEVFVNIDDINSLITHRKIVHESLGPVFFILSSFETFQWI